MLRFSALGTEVTISGEGEAAAADEVTRLGGLLTRFRPSSLTALNRHGELHGPPPELVQAVRHALDVSARTGGRVTPAVLPALEAAGYASRPGTFRGAGTCVLGTAAVICTPELIRLPAGMRLDLGGTAKSWIAEQASRHLHGDGLIDAGGDVMLRQSGVFAIEIARPFGDPGHLGPLYLECPPGTWGIATSSTLKRAWAGGHHLIDPRTARPLISPLVQVTVITAHLTDAEVLTKLAFLDPDRLDDVQGSAQVYAFDHQGRFLKRHEQCWQVTALNL